MADSNNEEASNYPLANSKATKMLAGGIERAARDTGATQRDIAKQLGYKTSVVLSHMASGRVPIPIDRALDIATLLNIDPLAFLLATLKQRHPQIEFDALLGIRLPQESALASELEAIAGIPLDDLPDRTKQILRDVVGSVQPERRWLSSAELLPIRMLRDRYPTLHRDGLPPEDRRRLADCLGGTADVAQS